jgi:hypothetical protein
MLEIGDYKLVNNSFSVTNTIAENTILKKDNSTLSKLLIVAVIIGGIVLYVHLMNKNKIPNITVPKVRKQAED